MATPKPEHEFTPQWLKSRLDQLGKANGYCVAFSGGGDSSALLLAMAAARTDLKVPISALHVHHGLNAQADDWSARCHALCERLDVPLTRVRVKVDPKQHAGPEDAARRARYQAFADHIEADEMLLTAHHLDDQAETVMLRLLRGSGVAGLAAMRAKKPLAQGWLCRPLLDLPRDALRAYIEAQGEAWVDDPSNQDRALDRNFLRHEIMPLLRQRWPAAERALARMADNAQEASQIISERAKQDLADCLGPQQSWLRLDPLTSLPCNRRHEVLRHWLLSLGLVPPGRDLIRRIDGQLIPAAADRKPRVRWPGGEVRRFQNLITAFTPPPPPPETMTWHPGREAQITFGGGTLTLEGAAPEQWCWQLRTRDGGESLKPEGSTCTRSLKNLLHEYQVPPWVRRRLPLIFEDDRLIGVADLIASEGLRERLNASQARLLWRASHPACGLFDDGRIEAS